MKRLFSVFVVLFFLAVSCSKSKPKGILSDKKMSDLMTEVYILDAYLNNLPIDSGRKVMPVLYQQLFDKFKIDSTVFMENIDYYYGDPVELEKINAVVKDVISRYEKDAMRVDSIEQAHTRDSINRVMRLQQWATEMKNLILNVHLDTTEYTFGMNNTAFFQRAAVSVQRHDLVKPTPAEPVEDGADIEGDTSTKEENEATPGTAVDSIGIDSTRRIERSWRYQDSTFRKLGIKEIRRKPLGDKIKQRLTQ